VGRRLAAAPGRARPPAGGLFVGDVADRAALSAAAPIGARPPQSAPSHCERVVIVVDSVRPWTVLIITDLIV